MTNTAAGGAPDSTRRAGPLAPGVAQEAIAAALGADALDGYITRYDALITDARASAEPDECAISTWAHARASAVLARDQLSTRDLARIGAAILQLRVAAEPRWPR